MCRIAADQVSAYINYDPTTGAFTRAVEKRCGKNNAVIRYKAGDAAGTVTKNGYVQIAIEGTVYYGHRLAFAIMTGEWPEHQVDHINGQRADNRWVNLRGATASVNQQNLRTAQRNNVTGMLGVSQSFGKFSARIVAGGKVKRLGRFETPEEAHAAYVSAKRSLQPGCTI